MKYYLFICFVLTFSSCKKSIRDAIYDDAHAATFKKTCYIDISDYTKFEWDSVYVSNAFCAIYNGDNKDIRDIAWDASGRLFMYFTKSNKLVHVEYTDLSIYCEPGKDMYFDMINDTVGYMSFSRQQSVFKVEVSDRRYYFGDWYEQDCINLVPVTLK